MEILLITFTGAIVAVVASIVLLQRVQKAEKAKQERAREQRTEIYRKFAEDFAKVGWSAWGYAIHMMPDQRPRMEKGIYSRSMKLLSYDANLHSACVLGERGAVYYIDEGGCSCPDFRTRRLPCKHMYFAVIEIQNEK